MSSELLTRFLPGEASEPVPVEERPWVLLPAVQSAAEQRSRYLQANALADELRLKGWGLAACWYAHPGVVSLLLALAIARRGAEDRSGVDWWQDCDRLLSMPVATTCLVHNVKSHPVDGAPTTSRLLPPFDEWLEIKFAVTQ